jgi:hypothetical protein
MKKYIKGIVLGAMAGIIDLVPMVVQNLDWSADISAFCFWVVAGFIISTSGIPLKGIQKGLVLSWILVIPMAVLIGRSEPRSLLPVFLMTTILGCALGYLLDKT